jgi:type I restriction enzyme, S subunit
MNSYPEDWQVRLIGDVAESSSKLFEGHQNTPPVLSVTKHRGFVLSSEYFDRQVYSKNLDKYKLVNKGEFAYATIHLDEGSIDVLTNFDNGLISPMYTVFKVKDIDPGFLIRLLKSDEYIRKYSSLGQGSIDRRMSIPFTALKELEIPYPPLNEQKRISEVLISVERLIELTSVEIERLKNLKQGITQELLTKGIGHSKFKESPFGDIPETWDVSNCGEICREICVGIVVKPSQYYKPKGVPTFRSANVRENKINASEFVYISTEDNEKLKKSKVFTGDLLTVRTGYPGTTCVIDERFNGSNCVDVIISRPKQDIILPHFLCLWINSDFGKGQVLKYQGGLAQQHFNVGELRELEIPIPTLKEQKKIVDKIQAIDSCIEKKHEFKTKVQSLRKGLLNDLINGKVRLKSK